MTSTSPAAASQPYMIRCAEIWGGTSVKEDQLATPGLHAAIHSSASGDSRGGDLYYVSVCAYDTLTRIAVADVRGHGESVNHLSEWLYQVLDERMNYPSSAAVLADLNDIVHSRGFEAITTAVVATFHRDNSTLYYSYAGHPPLLLGRYGLPWQTLAPGKTQGPSNLPLGVLKSARFTQEQIRVEPTDRLFFYSDGVSECPGAGEEMYGDHNMLQTLEATRLLPLHEAREAIREDMARFAGGPLIHDDCTFLLIEPLGPVPFWKRRFFPAKRRRVSQQDSQ